MNRPNIVDRSLLELTRKTAKGYNCPVCGQFYSQEPRIWEHAVSSHPEYLESLESMVTVNDARKQFRQEALDKAQHKATSVGKAVPMALDAAYESKLSPSRYKAVEGGSGDEATKSGPTAAFNIAQVQPQGPEKKIDDIGTLSLEQARSQEPKDRPITINNPRKRGPEGESGSPGPPKGGYSEEPISTRPRHSKTLSRGRDAEFTRQGAQPDDSDYRRGTMDPKQPLWDPNNDSPNMPKGARLEKQQGLTSSTRWNHPPDVLSHTNQGLHFGGKNHTYSQGEVGLGRPWIQQRNNPTDRARRPYSINQDQEDGMIESPPLDDLAEGYHADSPEAEPEMLLQPETRPISHEQLVVEVKGIYAGLVMVEAKCIDIDERQSAAAQEKDPSKRIDLKNDQWQSLIALHKQVKLDVLHVLQLRMLQWLSMTCQQLLHEHHDFFLASQHPSATPALSRLAAKYSMPARMWRHGIHAFLEVLRHRLPESLEHMLAFIYIAYSMMALLYETVPTFEDTWIECLGDLGRYRMAIEDDDPRDREVWSSVAKFWYHKASDNTPITGRLYHHLAILARPYTLEQLSLYTRSLTCVIPFESAKGSIMTLFNPILHSKDTNQRRPSSLETVFIRIHALLFTSKPSESSKDFNKYVDELEKDSLFKKYIIKAAARFKQTGAYAAIANIAALFEYGSARIGASKPQLRLAFENAQAMREQTAKPTPTTSNHHANFPPPAESPQHDAEDTMTIVSNESKAFITQSSRLSSITLSICLERPSDCNVYPLVHIYLGFLWSLIIVQQACEYFEREIILQTIEKDIPWIGVCWFLNTLASDPQATTSRIWCEEFPRPVKEVGRPLPEDYVLRGQMFTQWLFPVNWFAAAMIDDDERSQDLPSMAQPRKERMLWLGHRIASANRWIHFDKERERFSTTEYANKSLVASSAPESDSQEQDSVMSEADTVEDTPRSRSLAMTESPDGSRQSTRASTPSVTLDLNVPAQRMTSRTARQSSCNR